jgi:hypothetical protein
MTTMLPLLRLEIGSSLPTLLEGTLCSGRRQIRIEEYIVGDVRVVRVL